MKITIHEWDDCFYFDIEPESVAEAALLVRMALNSTRGISSIDTSVPKHGAFNTSFFVGKKKRATAQVRSA